MKEILEIIDLLSNENASLSQALLKTKVLLHKIDQPEISEWVDLELNSYPDPDNLPNYRITKARVLGNILAPNLQGKAQPIPIQHLSEREQKDLTESCITESLPALQGSVVNNPEGMLIRELPPESYHHLGKGLAAHIHINRAWCEINELDLTQIFIHVRSKLLDFMLKIDREFSDDLSDDQVKVKSSEIDVHTMFSNTMFGDNTTFIIGHNHTVNITNTVTRGDFDSLAEALRTNNVSDTDIRSLEAAIDADIGQEDPENRKFGPSVNAWLKEMLGKAVESAWQIEISIAGSFLYNALRTFYSW